MKIGFVSIESAFSDGTGGQGFHVSDLAKTLNASGHEVHVFTKGQKEQEKDEVIEGVSYHRVLVDEHSFFSRVASWDEEVTKRIDLFEQETGPLDVYDCEQWTSVKPLLHLKEKGRKVVLTMHTIEKARQRNVAEAKQLEQQGVDAAHRVIAVSAPLASEIQEEYKCPIQKLRIVQNAVDFSRFDVPVDAAAVKKSLDIDPNDAMVLFVGRLIAHKGPDLLVSAASEVLKERPYTKFVFVGLGELFDKLQAQAAQLNIDNNCRFVGRKSAQDLAVLYKACDVLVLPSRWESFGIVILEAWAAAKPVVATNVGGPSKFVWDSYDGLLAEPNPSSIAEAVIKMLGDPIAAKEMGRNGKLKALNSHSWQAVAQITTSIFDEITL